MSELFHSIGSVSKRTGLSPHVIRIWERRYGAVTPTRTATNRRVYADTEVERLILLQQVTASGHNISNIARLPIERLRDLAQVSKAGDVPEIAVNRGPGGSAAHAELFEECVTAVKQLDGRRLEQALDRGYLVLGSQGLLIHLVGPLTQAVGNLWRQGTIMAAHEHFATAIIRNYLSQNYKPFALADHSPVLVMATPSGQLHELGAVIAASAAVNVGWKVTYLGPSLPAGEIAAAAIQNRARAVGLSIVFPEDDPLLARELQTLRKLLPREVPLVVGGRSAHAYQDALDLVGAHVVGGLEELCSVLDSIRSVSPSPFRN